jgi:hypothetical protein
MRPHDGGVHRDGPVDFTRRVDGGLDLLEQTLPRPVARPQSVAFVDGLPRPEPVRRVTSLHAGPHPVQHPVDHLPVIPPPATTPVTDWQERPQPFPLGITQLTRSHSTRRTHRHRSRDHLAVIKHSSRPVEATQVSRLGPLLQHPLCRRSAPAPPRPGLGGGCSRSGGTSRVITRPAVIA